MKRTKRFLLSLLTLLCCNTGMWASSIPGALSGRFTINASGEKVLFSQGNLQYQASTDTWRFAENQYDYIGSANSSISESYTGWIDLFGWATNGLEANTATGKMPYYTGTTDEDYGPSITSGEFDKTIYDWGKAIDDSWHTLSNAEWNYIFAGRASYSSLYGFGRLFGVNGVFLLPDDWSWSETSIATAATAAGFAWSGGAKNFSSNIISNNTLWSVMESAGAVFIPAAGYRQGTTINMSGDGGDYWSSTASSDKKAYRTSFYNEHLNLSNNYGRSDGISVRLVRSSLEKDGEGNYLLSSAQDWKDFAAIVNSGTNPAANAKMTADIDLGDDQTMIGTGTQWSDYGETGILRFQGVFDGQGHTLTINYNATTESFTAPFRHIKKATIKNLRVAGTITTNHTIAAGIASSCAGNGDNSYIINCVSSVDIISNYVNSGHPIYDGARTAGIIGQIFHNAHINISDCIFNGSISGETQQVLWGGMVGSPDGPVTITNSLQIGSFDCSDVVTGNEGSGTFSTIWNKNINITNSYYLNALGAVQGTQATSAQLADGTIATALQNGRAEEVWVQDLVTNQPMLKMFASLWQDGEETYCIGSDAGWTAFANGINDGTIAINANAKLMADIDLGDDQTMVGTISVPYQGEFDGQGHTLTVNYNMRNDITGVAPFACVGDATIQNLHVAGSVIQQNIGAGGIVAQIKGNLTMKRCWVSAYVNAAIGTVAGIAGYCDYEEVYNKTILLEDCLFSGHIDQGYYSGGLMSHIHGSDGYNNSAQFNNCLNVGTCNNPSGSTGTFARTGTQGDPYTITNCYYKIAWRVAQGTQASTAQLADGTTAYKLQNNRGDMVWGQRIGTDAMPVLTNDENYRVYRSKTGGYTNNPEEAYEGIQQDGEGNYLLGSLPDWQVFAEIVNSGTNAAANAKMTADIDLGDDQTHIGSVTEGATPYYAGIFDGQGHTLTVNYVGGSDQIVAPFTQISSATIKNLHIAGSIQSSFAYIGVVGKAGSGSVISNVWMSATMNTTQDGWVQSAAIAGYCDGSIQDCLFTGTYTSNGGGYMGGFYGYTNASPTITNCLSTGTFSQGNWQGNGVHTNCYLKQYPADLTTGCSWATNETLSDGTIATALQNSRAEEVWVQDPMTNQPMLKIFANAAYTVPSSGIGTFSAKAKFAVPDGLNAYYCKTYDKEKGTISVVAIEGAVPANTGVILKGAPGETYTLTGTNDDAATVTDNALVAVTEATHVDPTSGDYTNFMMSGGKFIRIAASAADVKMSANKAYLQILTSALPSDPAAQARDIVLSWDEEDPTGINEVRGKKEDVRGEIYNLSGQRVSKPTKGLYIIGGKKVFIP